MKIAVDLRLWSAGGIGTFLKEILKELLKDATLTFYFLGFEEEQKEIEKTFSNSFFTYISLKSSVYSLKEQLELPFKIPPVDLFWTPHFNVPLLPIMAKKRLVTINDVYHLAFHKTQSTLQKLYAQAFYNIALHHADYVTTISRFSWEEIYRYCFAKPKKLEVIHNGINAKRFSDSKNREKFLNIHARYMLPERYLLAVGNLRPHKNLSRVAMALESLLEENTDYHMVIIGKDKGFRSEDALLKELSVKSSLKGKIHILGSLPDEDLPFVYGHAEMFIFPSLYEGFGFPPLEAMAAQCPVIASSAASIPEICSDACIYIDPLSIDEIKHAIKLLWGNVDLRRNLIEKGLQRIQHFSWQNTAEKYKQIISQLKVTS